MVFSLAVVRYNGASAVPLCGIERTIGYDKSQAGFALE